MSEYFAQRRFEFYRAGFKTIRLPGVMCGPVFMVAYDIARICQVEFTPAVKHPGRAAKIKALGMLLMETPEFRRLRPQTRKRYQRWLDEFCYQIGGRLLPTMRYIPLVRQYREKPSPALLRDRCWELRALLRRAADQQSHPAGYQPRPVSVAPAPLPFLTLSPENQELLKQLRRPWKAGAPRDETRKAILAAMRAHGSQKKWLSKTPKSFQSCVKAMRARSANVCGSQG